MDLGAHAYVYAHTGTLILMENFCLAFRELVPKILLNVTEVGVEISLRTALQ